MGKIYTALGLMSGTSLDGVDVSIIESDGDREYLSILDRYFEYDNNLFQKILNLRDKISNSEDLNLHAKETKFLEREITLFQAQAVNETLKITKSDVDLVGFHGQTIFHDPKNKFTKQLGDGILLSQLIKKKVIYNFRQNDLENGGQGAPLTPIFHNALANKINKKFNLQFPINILNIGGISNITTTVNENDLWKKNKIYAYDIGPGNCLIDEWVRKNSNKNFDNNGDLARIGNVNELVFNQAVENFSNFSYNKSLDIKDYDITFAKGLSLEDGCATITKFTAYLIAEGLKMISNQDDSFSKTNILCGGGRKNISLLQNISSFLSHIKIEFKNIDEYELNGDYIESQAFGYLSIRSFLNLPISFPKTTRCKSPTLGGTINKNF